MTFLTGLLFIALATFLGRALLPSRQILARSLWEELGVAYLLGTAVIVVVITAGFLLGFKMALLWWLPVLAGAAGWVLERQRMGATSNLAEVPWSRPMGALLATLAVAAVLTTLALPLNEFDPIYHFAYRGKVLLYEGTPLNEAITGILSNDGYGRLVTHPNYPLGVPILEAWTAHWGGWSDRWVQLPLALWSACLPMVVAFGLRGYSKSAASYGAVLSAATPILYSYDFLADGLSGLSMAGLSSTLTLGGGADLAVMAMLGVAAALFVRARQVDCRRTAICAGLGLAGAVMMKNEGLALAGVCVLAVLLTLLLPPRRIRMAIPFVAVAMLGIAPWLGLRSQLPSIDENYSAHMTAENILHYLGGGRELIEKAPLAMSGREQPDFENAPARVGLVLLAFWDEFTDWRSWGLLWLLVIVALPVTRQRLQDPELRWLSLLVLGGVGVYFLTLLVTPWNFPSLRDKGIPERLLVHLVGPIMLMFGAILPKKDT
jgi:hypothetical protein